MHGEFTMDRVSRVDLKAEPNGRFRVFTQWIWTCRSDLGESKTRNGHLSLANVQIGSSKEWNGRVITNALSAGDVSLKKFTWSELRINGRQCSASPEQRQCISALINGRANPWQLGEGQAFLTDREWFNEWRACVGYAQILADT
jgi:hypothetical protein